MGGTGQQLEGSVVQKGNMSGTLVCLVPLGWVSRIVFCVVQIIAVYSSGMLVRTGGLCHGALAFFS